MLRRTRTTKKLAKRIDLQYFARPHRFRQWRLWLSVAVPVVAGAWFVTQRAQGGQEIYSSGPLSHAHAVFTQKCALCHVSEAGALAAHVTDKACLTCHEAPLHHANQTSSPACVTCHTEHKGVTRLRETSDTVCTECHGQLQTRDGQAHYVSSIRGFVSRHPEFAVLRSGTADPGGVRLNHYLHLQPNLMGPHNARVQMTCDDCHRTAGSEAWPYAGAQTKPVATMATGKQAYMPPPEFTKHCAGCHTLQFDKRFGNDQVPHDKPEVVHAFLVKRFSEYIAIHANAVHEVDRPNRQILEREQMPQVARNAGEWVEFRVEDAEWLLYAKTCKQCHTLKPTLGSLPEVAKSNFTARWLTHAEFDHHAHRMMTCSTCHSRSAGSHETADVLLPGIETCRQCHRESKRTEAADGRCFECHQYHDWTKAKPTKGGFTIQQLRGSTEASVPQG